MTIRPEQPTDATGIRAVLMSAFPTDAEARLVEALRASGRLTISLVAEEGGRVVGHVAFSPVTIDGKEGGLGLAPVAVASDYQRRGVGRQLIEDGIKRARESVTTFVVVLGHPEYYPRFGFQKASNFGLQNEYGADDAFMVLELRSGGLPNGGLVKYCDEFAMFG